MQTLTIEVKDSFMKMIENAKDNVVVKKDEVPFNAIKLRKKLPKSELWL